MRDVHCRFDDVYWMRLAELCTLRRLPMAEVIRDAVEQYLDGEDQSEKAQINKIKTLSAIKNECESTGKLIRELKSGLGQPANGSQDHQIAALSNLKKDLDAQLSHLTRSFDPKLSELEEKVKASFLGFTDKVADVLSNVSSKQDRILTLLGSTSAVGVSQTGRFARWKNTISRLKKVLFGPIVPWVVTWILVGVMATGLPLIVKRIDELDSKVKKLELDPSKTSNKTAGSASAEDKKKPAKRPK